MGGDGGGGGGGVVAVEKPGVVVVGQRQLPSCTFYQVVTLIKVSKCKSIKPYLFKEAADTERNLPGKGSCKYLLIFTNAC